MKPPGHKPPSRLFLNLSISLVLPTAVALILGVLLMAQTSPAAEPPADTKLNPSTDVDPKLVERWDARYRDDGRPAWDTGRPSSNLKRMLEKKNLQPCRVLELGCGTGVNAVYLAEQGFEVTAIDIAPTALTLAKQRADEAGVEVEWIQADVLTPPPLESFDLIFDRGCYHHISQYDSPGYAETLRRLSHAGTRAMILAGSPADGNRGGPPRIEEETIRRDFSTMFDFEWLRDIHFDARDPNVKGPSAWSIHLRRKSE